MFDERGFHSASMDDIADAVGLRKPSLYHYFRSKEEILFQIHDDFIELLISRHEQRLHLGFETKALLLEAMGDIIEIMETHPGYVRVFFEAIRELSDAKRQEIIAKRTRYQQLIIDVLEKGVQQGVLRSIPAPLAAQGLFGMCTWAYQWYHPTGALRPRDIASVFWDIYMNGTAAS